MAVTIAADNDAFGIKWKYGVKYVKAKKHITPIKGSKYEIHYLINSK